MTRPRAFGAVGCLAAAFLLGLGLAASPFLLPSVTPRFPSGKFVAVLPDATPLIPVHGRKTATLEVRARSAGRYQVGGSAFCNSWGGELTVLPGKRIVWGDVYVTAIACANVMAAEATYLQALLGASRWRTEEGALILDNGTHILRFVLAPS